MRSAVRVPFEGDRRHGDHGSRGKSLFQLVILGLAFGETEPPTIVVDHDADVVWIVEGRRTPIERRVVELPLGRGQLPDELREIAPVSLVAGSAAFGGEAMGDRPRSPEEPPRRASALATKPATSSKVKAVQKPLTLDETPPAGKPKKLALTAAICELAVILNAILRTGTPWRAAETAA